jgi:hypothetical protein
MFITLQTVPTDCLLHIGTFLKYPRSSKRNDIDGITLAATMNHHDMLEHYMQKHTPDRIPEKVTPSGNRPTFKLLDPGDLERSRKEYTLSDMSRKVVQSGNLKALKWVVKKGCPMDENTGNAAAESENLKMLQWLRSQGCPWDH